MSDRIKPLEVRVREAVEVRAQLQQLGILTQPAHGGAVRTRMNAFVREGLPSTYDIRLPENAGTIKVQLSLSRKSGITLYKEKKSG